LLNKASRQLICMTLFFSFFAAIPCFSFEPYEQGIVKANYVNLRLEPKFNSPLIAKKLRGETYKIILSEDSWCKIRFEDQTEGWIFKTLVSLVTPSQEEYTPVQEKPVQKQSEVDLPVKSKQLQQQPSSKNETASARNPLLEDTTMTPAKLYNNALEMFEKGRYSDALELNKKAAVDAPQNADIYNNMGAAAFHLGKYEEALKYWKTAYSIDKNSSAVANNLGIASYRLNRNNDAIEYYKQAIEKDPDFADAYYNLAGAYGFMGKYDLAIENYNKFLSFSPDSKLRKIAESRIDFCKQQSRQTFTK